MIQLPSIGDSGPAWLLQSISSTIKAIQTNSGVSFSTPWGEEMHMRAGDFIVDAGNGDRYGIAQKEFNETYVPAN